MAFYLQKLGEKFEVTLLVILLFNTIMLLASQSLSLEEVHLVRCLTLISHRYFAPGISVVISSPSTYRDVQQELIAEIHRTAIWPVVFTVDGNISKPNKTDFINKDGSYIILLPDGNITSFEAEIMGLAVGRDKLTRFWNYDARFVVAGGNEFSMSQQKTIFEYFSQLRIYNCIIISREHYEINSEYSRPLNVNDVDTGMKLGVYSWFPYQISDRCTEVNDIILVDRWFISAQGHFMMNNDLFPGKISKSFKACPMKAVVQDGHLEFSTVSVYHKDSNGNVVRYIDGLEMKLLKIVLEKVNMKFVLVTTIDDFEMEKRLFPHLFRAMISKEVDIYLGDQTIHNLLLSFFDTTNTYNIINVRWYVPCSVKYPRWSSIFRILSEELWLVLIVSIIFAGISITLVGRYSCTPERQCYKTIKSSLTNVWAVFLGVPVSTIPSAPSLRSLFLSWVCFSLAFSTVFQVFLTTYLIDSGYKTSIRNIDELFDSGIMLAYQPEHNYIIKNGDKKESMIVKRFRVNCPTYEVFMDWVKYQKNISILMADTVAELHYADGDFVGENSERLVCRLEDGVLFNTGHSMTMFHGDQLFRRFNDIINRVVEEGIYNYWISLIMNRHKIKSQKIAIVRPLDGYYSFNLYHMKPAFYLLLMGWCISVLCFVIEVFCNRVLSKIK